MTQERELPETYELLGADLVAFDRGTRILPFTRADGAVVPTSWTGSSMLRGLASSDGLMVVRPGPTATGTPVQTLRALWRQS